MNIYILLEIKKRELYSKVLLSAEAAMNGHEVYFGKLTPFLLKNVFKPGIVHFKSITPGISRINELKFLKKKKFLTTSLDEEHGLINDYNDYGNYRYSPKSFDLISKVFTWGKFDFKTLLKKYPKYKNKLVKSGNPRVDFWRKDFKNFFSNQPNLNLKDYILLSANFEGFGYKTLNDRIKFHSKTGYFQRGVSKTKMINKYKQSIRLFKLYENTIKKISNLYKDKKIVIKTHPKDNPSLWKKKFRKFKNILIVSDGIISDWISNAKIVIHAGCTGGLEASLREKFTISYYPLKINHGHKFADLFSQKIYEERILLKKINEVYKNLKFKNKFKPTKINERAFNYYGRRSYKTIIRTWTELGKKIIFKRNNIFFLKILFFLLDIKLKILNIKTENHKFDKFDKNEINKIISRLSKIDKKYKNIRVDFLRNDIIKFTKI